MKHLVLALSLVASAAFAEQIAEPADYRMDHYRAPVPGTISGGSVVGP